jgi:beta-xylosidase
MRTLILIITLLFCSAWADGQGHPPIYPSQVWNPDNGDGTYKNPIIHADYSDPDVTRVGNDYYMVASSFNHAPGLPILHSKDLVNWTLLGHVLKNLVPYDHFSKVQHGGGVWAPSIRHHKGEFYIYYPDPDFGIYLVKAKDPLGPWSEPMLVEAGKGLIDPCPLFEENGRAWLVHAFAGSRAGVKSVLVIKQMNEQGTRTIDNGFLAYDGHEKDPTVEGPKFYKRNGYYYIFAPAGGVATGWQTVLRSPNIYGPYERKVVLDQGTTSINGPHQGAWVDTEKGEHWFIHFQDKGAYGRVVHLQPMKWVNDWPVIGVDNNGDGKGEPVLTYKMPSLKSAFKITPHDTDEFSVVWPSRQWQWQANPKASWAVKRSPAGLRLYSEQIPENAKNYWDVTNLFMQKFPAEEFMVTTKLSFKPRHDGERAGLIVFGADYAFISMVKKEDGIYISHHHCKEADKGTAPVENTGEKITGDNIYFRVKVRVGAVCEISYSLNGTDYHTTLTALVAKPGKWVGAKIGLFCTRTIKTNDSGFADFDWFRVQKVK